MPTGEDSASTLTHVLVARAGLSPVMVGRDAELAALLGLLDAEERLPCVAVITGEAGVGKSRLVRELAESADVPVVAAAAEPIAAARPFALVRDAVADRVTAWDRIPGELADREHAVRHVLAPLLHEHAPTGDHEHPAEELERAAVEVLAHALGHDGGLIIFEDLHWADPSSVAVLNRLSAMPGLRATIVVTVRPEDLDRRHPAAAILADLERRQQVTRLALGRLDHRNLETMLEAVYAKSVPTATVHALHERTQGNPFFVEELVACCGVTDPDELSEVGLPWNVTEAVLRRVDDLDPTTRRVLDVAALLGNRVPFELLAAATGDTEDALITALRELVERRLLAEREPDVFTFRHALTREAAADRLLGRERRRIHTAALDALLAGRSDDHAAIARHAAGAERDDELVAAAIQGAEAAYREGSTLGALQLAEMALRGARTLDDPDAMRLHRVAARAALALGALADAEHHSTAWLELARTLDDAAEQSFALRGIGSVRHLLGDEQGHREAVQDALEAAEPLGPSDSLAWALSYRSRALMLNGEASEAIEWADKALAMAEEVGCEDVRAYTLVNKGMALTELPGTAEEGLALLDEARVEARRRRDLVTQGRAIVNSVVHLIWDSDDDERRITELLDEAEALAERYGLDMATGKASVFQAILAIQRGDLAAASAELPGLGLAPQSQEALLAGLIAVERGHGDAARAALEAFRGEAPDRRAPTVSEVGPLLLGLQIAALEADDAGLRSALASLASRTPEGMCRDDRSNPMGVVEALVVAHRAGVEDEDLAGLVELVRSVVDPQRPFRALDLAVTEGLVAHRAGDHETCVEELTKLPATGRLPRAAWVRAEVEGILAESLAALGRSDEARVVIRRAVDRLERWPGRRQEQLAGLARRLGAGTAEDTDADALLTPREREVLTLIAKGRSNREIAEALYIAQKTAAVHVSNILAKTGFSGRTEAAAWALREGLVEQ